jgi:hypothetical protein
MLPLVLTRHERVPRVSAGPIVLIDPDVCTTAECVVAHESPVDGAMGAMSCKLDVRVVVR